MSILSQFLGRSKKAPAAIPSTDGLEGIHVIRGAFKREAAGELLARLDAYRSDALKVLAGEMEPAFPPQYRFNKGTLAITLSGIDPDTDTLDAENVTQTSLFKALKAGGAWDEIAAIVTPDAIFQGARVRVVDPAGGRPGDRRGAVFFHQEKWVMRGYNLPVGHNVWMPLNTDGYVANKTMSGIQFALGNNAFWQDNNTEGYEERVLPRVNLLNRQARQAPEGGQEFVEVEGQMFYRPHLSLGDLVIFDHSIPHGSFVPAKAEAVRVSCELRVFPREGFPEAFLHLHQ
jgi:hypothetical protein